MEQPIGVIDSGVGGLTVAKEIMRQLPNEQILYLGDTARCPYGPREQEEITLFTWQLTNFLLAKKIKLLVIACNTATAAALAEIKKTLSIPVIGVIYPGAITALKVSRTKKIGVIGTEGTINSRAYEEALKAIDKEVSIVSQACPKFVPLVESGEFDGAIARRIVAEALYPLTNKGLDTLILGCTHYPLLQHLIQDYLGPHIQVISSGEETAREVSSILYYQDILAGERTFEHKFYTTGSSKLFSSIASSWLERPVTNVETIKLETTSLL